MACSIDRVAVDSLAITHHIHQCQSKTPKKDLQQLFSEQAEKLALIYSRNCQHSLILLDLNPKVTFPSFTSLVLEINSIALTTLNIAERDLPGDIQTYISKRQPTLL